MITAGQSEQLERQQNQALKNIYGLDISSQKMRDRAGIDRLETRRRNALKKFALKNASSARFKSWFVEKPPTHRSHRQEI